MMMVHSDDTTAALLQATRWLNWPLLIIDLHVFKLKSTTREPEIIIDEGDDVFTAIVAKRITPCHLSWLFALKRLILVCDNNTKKEPVKTVIQDRIDDKLIRWGSRNNRHLLLNIFAYIFLEMSVLEY